MKKPQSKELKEAYKEMRETARRARFNIARKKRRLELQMAHGVCKRSHVVSVKDVPPKIPFSRWGTLVQKVYSLPRTKGLSLPTMHDQGMAKRRAFSISNRAKAMGMPVTCRVRFCDFDSVKGWRVFVFKRSDLTKKRNGKETR